MAIAPNGNRRITFTISYPALAKDLIQYGYSIIPGLGKVTLRDDDTLELTTEESMREDIQYARQIADAEAAQKQEEDERREKRMEKRRRKRGQVALS